MLWAVLVGVLPATHAGIAPPSPISEDQCPAFKSVDRSKLPIRYTDSTPDGPLLDQVWNEWANTDLDVPWRTQRPLAKIHVERVRSGLSATGHFLRVVVGRKSASGWEIYAREKENAPLADWTSWREVQVSEVTQKRIDAVLADPCLWSAPRHLEQGVALKNGRYDLRPDGPFNYYDVTSGNRRWGGMHISWTAGTPGQLSIILMTAAYGDPAYEPDAIDSEGWLDSPP